MRCHPEVLAMSIPRSTPLWLRRDTKNKRPSERRLKHEEFVHRFCSLFGVSEALSGTWENTKIVSATFIAYKSIQASCHRRICLFTWSRYCIVFPTQLEYIYIYIWIYRVSPRHLSDGIEFNHILLVGPSPLLFTGLISRSVTPTEIEWNGKSSTSTPPLLQF